jgi:hypothetical protein
MELREKVLTLPINDEEDIVKWGGGVGSGNKGKIHS